MRSQKPARSNVSWLLFPPARWANGDLFITVDQRQQSPIWVIFVAQMGHFQRILEDSEQAVASGEKKRFEAAVGFEFAQYVFDVVPDGLVGDKK